MKYLLLVLLTLMVLPSARAQAFPPDLSFETTPGGALVRWERSDPNTLFAGATIYAPNGTVRYVNLFNPPRYNMTLFDDLLPGEYVVIREFAGIVIDGVPQVAAVHRSAPYAIAWRVRLPYAAVP